VNGAPAITMMTSLKFTSATIRHKLSSAIFQVNATTKEKTKTTSKEKA
jgi:hypothetical protein